MPRNEYEETKTRHELRIMYMASDALGVNTW
jgi:hypothetical protein